MTTQHFYAAFYTAGCLLGALVISTSVALAQTSPTTLSEGPSAISSEEATSTLSVESVTSVEPWFKIEKLTGTVDQGDFVVGPGRVEIIVKPGQTVVYEMSIANRISDNRRFELEIEDISGTDDANQAVIFLGSESGPYTVKDYISFPANYLNLDLGDRARIPVKISIPPNASPGGYYGGVLVSTVKNDGMGDEIGTAQSPIIARIGTLFFITVPGEINKEGKLQDFTLASNKLWFEKGPIAFNFLYENTGSIHLNPYGEIRIRNFFGEEVGFTELEPWFVLPKSLRTRTVSWDREILLGRYTATAFVNRGYDDIVDELTITFWVLPWKFVLSLFITIFVVLFSIRFIFKRFEFKRRA